MAIIHVHNINAEPLPNEPHKFAQCWGRNKDIGPNFIQE